MAAGDAGYTTGLIGKWGLGNFGTTGYPNARGFDHFLGQDTQVGCHNWYPLSICNDTVHEAVINHKSDLAYMSCLGPHATCTWMNDLDRTEGVAFIRSATAKKKPFFLYLSSTTPHAGNLEGTGPKPALFSSYNPVPYPWNQKFANETVGQNGALWTNKEKLFASAVWAEDAMVGAVLDELEALSIEKQTVVFFSGDNGPDIPGALFDDAGFFRGKKRSLHEGGIRQTIVVQWPGVIAPNSISNDLFIFYDLLPTAADLAGVDPKVYAFSDGLSAVPIFAATRENAVSQLAPSSPTSNRFLYYEFCHESYVNNNNYMQSYANGWGQAVRFDANDTAYSTQWKAIAVNSDYTNVLLYNITDDQSESVPLAGTPVGPDVTITLTDSPRRGSPEVAKALAHAIGELQRCKAKQYTAVPPASFHRSQTMSWNPRVPETLLLLGSFAGIRPVSLAACGEPILEVFQERHRQVLRLLLQPRRLQSTMQALWPCPTTAGGPTAATHATWCPHCRLAAGWHLVGLQRQALQHRRRFVWNH